MIRSNDVGFKNCDAICGGYFGKLAQQYAPESASLKIIGYRKRNLRPLLCDSHVKCVPYDTLLVTSASIYSKRMV
jgi:hypothetical protein